MTNTPSWQHSQNISTPLHILKPFAVFFVVVAIPELLGGLRGFLIFQIHILKPFAGFFIVVAIPELFRGSQGGLLFGILDFSDSHTEAICWFFRRFFKFTY